MAADDPGALFDKGLADMKAGRFAQACAELAESYRLDPHAGGLFTLAECENQAGKIASAMKDYDGFLDLVGQLPAKEKRKQEARAKVAVERRTALARDVPSLTITLAPDVPQGSTVSVDGKAVPAASFGSAVNQDPGDHVILLEAPDGRTANQNLTLAPHDSRAVTLTFPATKPVAKPSEPAADDPGASWRTAAYVTGGVGVAGVLAGSVMGAIVLADKSSITKNCPTASTCASPADASSANSARTLGWASTGAFIAGGAAVGAAVILWFGKPSKTASVEPVVAPSTNGGMVGLRGGF
jgi:hypothetical protein